MGVGRVTFHEGDFGVKFFIEVDITVEDRGELEANIVVGTLHMIESQGFSYHTLQCEG